jgi:hypothetical protein
MDTNNRGSLIHGVQELNGYRGRHRNGGQRRSPPLRKGTVRPGNGAKTESLDGVFQRIDEHTKKYRVRSWEGTFRDYLPMVLANPKLAQLTHARIYDMVSEVNP